MPTALLSGPFGRRDPGDEAVAASVLDALPDWDIVIESEDPSDTRLRHGARGVRAGSPVDLIAATTAADAVICAGGSLLADDGPIPTGGGRSAPRRTIAPSLGAALPSKRLALLGTGAGHPNGGRGRRRMRALVSGADLVIVRDEASAATLTDYGAPAPVRIGADPIWSGRSPLRRDDRDGACLVLRMDEVDHALVAMLRDLATELDGRGLRTSVMPWRHPAGRAPDVTVARAVAVSTGRPVEVLSPQRDLDGAIAALAGFEVAVTTSFHALAAAALASTPVVAVGIAPGVEALARNLEIPSVPASAGSDRLGPVPEHVVAARRSAAEDGFRLLRLVLSEGAADDDGAGLSLGPGWPP